MTQSGSALFTRRKGHEHKVALSLVNLDADRISELSVLTGGNIERELLVDALSVSTRSGRLICRNRLRADDYLSPRMPFLRITDRRRNVV